MSRKQDERENWRKIKSRPFEEKKMAERGRCVNIYKATLQSYLSAFYRSFCFPPEWGWAVIHYWDNLVFVKLPGAVWICLPFPLQWEQDGRVNSGKEGCFSVDHHSGEASSQQSWRRFFFFINETSLSAFMAASFLSKIFFFNMHDQSEECKM